jgi:ABC-type siderophore export system fused ATPase/permease subunit
MTDEIERLERLVVLGQRVLEDAQRDVKKVSMASLAVVGCAISIIVAAIISDAVILIFLSVPLVLACALFNAVCEDDPYKFERQARRDLEDAENALNREYMKGMM